MKARWFSIIILGSSLMCVQGAVAPSFAESLVKTRQECTRFGGRLERNTGSDRKEYPWVCHTPSRDKACERKFGEEYYFDAEYGKCMEDEFYYCDWADEDDCW